ncbi:MAG: serpin family protein [Armatimonadota bacterium]
MKSKIHVIAAIILFVVLIAWAAYSRFVTRDGCFICAHSTTNTEIDPSLASADNDFAFKLFSALTKDEGLMENIFVSPPSISLALSMTLNGAGGSTAQSMSKTLGFESMQLEEINSSNANMMRSLENGDPKVEISIANSLWLSKDGDFKKDFLGHTVRAYQAEIDTLDFTSPGAAKMVNRWVSKSTRGNIRDIVDSSSLNSDTVMLLINAIYFNGKWTKSFDPSKTHNRPFYSPHGHKSVKMMRNSGKYRYAEGSDIQAISLPYGDKRFSMYIFLPSKVDGLKKFRKELNAENWKKWLASMGTCSGQIMLPRFKMEYDSSLKEILSQMGMSNAFKQSADFAAMSDMKPLFIDDVIHKTFLEVDEKGTKAAAVTRVSMAKSAVMEAPGHSFLMIVDRPFFSAIVDNQSGLILFMGAITNP